jgi:PAS domain S-box-containing protein
LDCNELKDNSSLLIQIFTSFSDKKYIEAILHAITTILPNALIIGSTTDGEIMNGAVSEDMTVLSFTQFYHTKLKVASVIHQDSVFESGRMLADKLISKDTKLMISFADGIYTNGEFFLNGIASVDSSVMIAGGLAGDRDKFVQTFVFTKDAIISKGAVAISLDSDSLYVHNQYNFNWKSIGNELIVTNAKDNHLYTIGDRSAIDTYSYYLGDDVVKHLPAIGVNFPLVITRGGVQIARAVIAIGEDGSLILAGNIHTGDRVHFAYGDINGILKDSKKLYDEICKHPIESIFIYSCMARRHIMPNYIELETLPAQDIAPTAGFFTYGEFFSNDKNELFNQTMTIVALSEDSQSYIDRPHETKKDDDMAGSTIIALTHLINVTSRENELHKKILKEQKDTFELLFDKANYGIFIFQDGKITHCNEKILDILGYSSKADIISKTVTDFSPVYQENGDSSIEKFTEIIEKLESKKISEFEWILIKSTGEEFYVEMVMTSINISQRSVIHIACRDIDNNKKLSKELLKKTEDLNKFNYTLENKIKEALRDLKSAQKLAKMASWRFDHKTGIIQSSQELNRIFGINPKVVKSYTIDDLRKVIHPDDLPMIEKQFGDHLKDKKAIKMRYRIVLYDKTIKYIEEHCSTRYDADGYPAISYGTIQDITASVESERQLDIKEKLLIEQSRLAEMGSMIGMIAHQWSQPINTISMLIQSLIVKYEREILDDDIIEVFDQKTSEQILLMSNTIDDFRNFFKPTNDKSDFSLNKAINTATSLLLILLTKHKVDLQITTDDDITLYGHQNELGQVIINIIHNAIDIMNSRKIENKIIKIITTRYEDRVKISINDNGGGIPDDVIGKVFDPYFSTKDEFKGTGLGLFMCKMIIEDHMNGEIKASNVEDGANFEIILKI